MSGGKVLRAKGGLYIVTRRYTAFVLSSVNLPLLLVGHGQTGAG